MEELKEKFGAKESLRRKLTRSRLNRSGHVERMEVEQLTKRTGALRVEGRWKRGRPRLRWEDCVKIDLLGMGGSG